MVPVPSWMPSLPASSSAHHQHPPLVRQWLAVVAVVLLLPFGTSYWQLHRWLAVEHCVLHHHHQPDSQNTTTEESPLSNIGTGLTCRGHHAAAAAAPYFVNTSSFSRDPPGIARLTTRISEASIPTSHDRETAVSPREHLQRLEGLVQKGLVEESEFRFYDYAGASSESLWGSPIAQPMGTASASKNDAAQDKLPEVDPNLGFRRNPNKPTTTSEQPSAMPPLATYAWLLLNVGLFGWYYSQKIDSSRVALSASLLAHGGDFGRALSGNLSHFEIWHLALNGFSLVSLGEGLEFGVPSVGGSLGLLLWTASLLALCALGVVGLFWVDRRFVRGCVVRRFGRGGSGQAHAPGFPSMVGFSGILFAWSVNWTLSLPDSQETCPIPLLSSVCFSTHTLLGRFRFSWAPLVQLVVFQALLHKRVSFVGHLSGTLVGFLWHWGVLPGLELSQPCVAYPLLWMAGKSALHRWGHGIVGGIVAAGDHHEGTGSASSRGAGGRALGSVGGNRWTLSPAIAEEESGRGGGQPPPKKIGTLQLVQRLTQIHLFLLLHVYRRRERFFLFHGVILSEILLMVVYGLFVRAIVHDNHNPTNGAATGRVHPLSSVGGLGRAYVAFAVVATATDAMTLGGWCALFLRPVWDVGIVAWIVMVLRLGLRGASVCVVCHALDAAHELGRNSDTAGIWHHVLGGSVAEPCASLGSALVEREWKLAAASASSSSGSAMPPVATGHRLGSEASSHTVLTTGRSTSNVAGKSRLV